MSDSVATLKRRQNTQKLVSEGRSARRNNVTTKLDEARKLALERKQRLASFTPATKATDGQGDDEDDFDF